MPMTRRAFLNPWDSKAFFLSFLLGVCFFQAIPKAFALEPNSPLFQQTPGSSKTSQPLALPEEKPEPLPSFFSVFARIILALAIIIALIYLTVWGLKVVWEKRGWNKTAEEGKLIRVLTSTYLAPRKTIHLVEVGKRILVVGVGNEEIHCLDVITSQEEVESLKQGAAGAFPDLLQKFLHRQEAPRGEEETKKIIEEGKEALGGYVEKLKKMSKRSGKTPAQDAGDKE